MSERLPYEEHLNQQWTELPLPDEDMAWEDMRRRLEEDDDRGIFWWWRPGCGIIGLLLLALGLGWWSQEGNEKKERKEAVVEEDSIGRIKRNVGVDTSLMNTNRSGSKVNEVVVRKLNGETINDDENKKPGSQVASRDQGPGPKANAITNRGSQTVARRNEKVGENKDAVKREVAARKDGLVNKELNDEKIAAVQKPTAADSNAVTNIDTTAKEPPHTDTIIAESKKEEPAKKPKADSPMVKKPVPPDSSERKSFFFSTGLALEQQLPVAGQKATPYNALGRKGSLLDYIPSVYVRLNREDKWFVQAEFKYGAPQYAKDLLYHQEVVPDTGAIPAFQVTTSNTLKKSFYHQLPFTFNYYVMPNWSVGAGAQWNKFYGAVSDQEIIWHDNINPRDSVVSKGIAVTKTDSTGAFEKSYFQAVFETQYKWKRFSAGARYTFGLTPYIRITIPNMPERREKNNNVRIFLRYELWRQK